MTFELGEYGRGVGAQLDRWEKNGFLHRLWNRDSSLWPLAGDEARDRLGWLDLPGKISKTAEPLKSFVEEVRADGIRRVILLGMGGSSLAPHMFSTIFGPRPGFPDLRVLDSTHPDAVAAAADDLEPNRLLILVSSKSGITLETLALFDYFWHRLEKTSSRPGRHFCAITDPGSPLERAAEEREFRRIFSSPPDVGGRYSALSVFGLVPAALLGLDLEEWSRIALDEAERMTPTANPSESEALRLGAVLGGIGSVRSQLTFSASPGLSGFPEWIEQLVAESLGKSGRGLLPVIEPAGRSLPSSGSGRLFVTLALGEEESLRLAGEREEARRGGHPAIGFDLADPSEIAGMIFRWEAAVAAAASIMDVHPFNQPDVQLSKALTREAMSAKATSGEAGFLPDGLRPAGDHESQKAGLERWLGSARDGDYMAIQAFLPPSLDLQAALEGLRSRLESRGHASTLGFGPRFLHSTGQLHKGGPDTGLFLQLIDDPGCDIPVPGRGFSFGGLLRAQADGDALALRDKGRRILRLDLGGDALAGLDRVDRILSEL